MFKVTRKFKKTSPQFGERASTKTREWWAETFEEAQEVVLGDLELHQKGQPGAKMFTVKRDGSRVLEGTIKSAVTSGAVDELGEVLKHEVTMETPAGQPSKMVFEYKIVER